MSSRTSKSKKLSLDELIFCALSQLQVHQYNQRSIRRYQTVWRKLITFARQQVRATSTAARGWFPDLPGKRLEFSLKD